MTSLLHRLICAFRRRVAHVEAGISNLEKMEKSWSRKPPRSGKE